MSTRGVLGGGINVPFNLQNRPFWAGDHIIRTPARGSGRKKSHQMSLLTPATDSPREKYGPECAEMISELKLNEEKREGRTFNAPDNI